MVLLCQSILEKKQILHLHGSVLFSIPLKFLAELVHDDLKTTEALPTVFLI